MIGLLFTLMYINNNPCLLTHALLRAHVLVPEHYDNTTSQAHNCHSYLTKLRFSWLFEDMFRAVGQPRWFLRVFCGLGYEHGLRRARADIEATRRNALGQEEEEEKTKKV
jgi:hypothetical protein